MAKGSIDNYLRCKKAYGSWFWLVGLIPHILLISEQPTLNGVSILLFGHKNRLQVDLGDLEEEKEKLATFLQSNLNVSVVPVENKLIVNPERLPVLDLQQAVVKFVHRHNFSSTHWVSVEGTTVKINRFKGTMKKKEKRNKIGSHQNVVQSWGL